MEKKVLTICLLLLPLMLMAAPITQEQAKQKASEFMTGHPKMAKGRMLKAAQAPLKMQQAETAASYYVFNVGEQEGFVVVSGDDRTPAILGYAASGNFDAANIPANMQAWLQGYEAQISKLDQYPAAQASVASHEAIAPLIKSTWGQGAPYNLMCPIDPSNNESSYSGCVATSMAQVMNYYKYPEMTTAVIPAYTTDSYGLSMRAIAKTTIDWDNMLDQYDDSATEAQQQAVAQLMLLCGQSVKMDYTAYGSYSYSSDVTTALSKYFGYDKNVHYAIRNLYRAAEWDNLIYEELQEGRPVIYRGSSLRDGHAFIIDGYSEDGLYHVNWGWNGNYDSYFLLSVLDPYVEGVNTTISPDAFNFYQEAVVGIQKPTEAEPSEDALALATDYLIIDAYETEFERQADGTFVLPVYISMVNLTATTRSFDIGCGIYNDQNEQVEAVKMFTKRNLAYYDYGWMSTTLTLPASLPDGTYSIKAVSRPINTDKWLIGTGDFEYYIGLTIKDNVAYTSSFGTFDLSGTIVSTIEQPTLGSPVPIRATITNNGRNFNQAMNLIVNGSNVGGFHIEAEAGETVDVDLSYIPTRSGANEVSLQQERYNGVVVAASGVVNILGSESTQLLFGFNVKDRRVNASVPHTNLDVTTLIHNNSRNAYNKRASIILYKRNNDGGWDVAEEKILNMTLAGDADSLLQLSFEGLENYTDYYLYGYYLGDDDRFHANDNEVVFLTTNESADGKEDMTYLINNPDFEWGESGWTIDAASGGHVQVGGTGDNYCFEAWNNRQFDIYQNVTGLPVGIYEIQVQGFYRNRRDINAWNAYQGGNINVPVYVYLNNSATPLKNVFEEPAEAGLYSGDYYVSPTGLYFPNDMATSAQAFSAGKYHQSAYGLIMNENEVVSIGVKGATNQNGDSWAIWDNFKLTYLGFNPEYMRPALQQALTTADGLVGQMMGKTVYGKLVDVIAEAKALEQSTDGEQMFQVLSRLYAISDEAVASATEFQELATALEELQWAIDTYHAASASVQQQSVDMLEQTTANALNHQYEEEDIYVLIDQINELIAMLRIPANMDHASITDPVDCTSLLINPSFEHNGENTIDGWYGSGYINFGNDDFQRQALALEVFQNNLTLYQPVYNIPNGWYVMQLSAFYRFGTPDQDAERYRQGVTQSHAVIYMDDPVNGGAQVTKPLVALSSEHATERLSNGEEWFTTDGFYVPNDMVSSVAYFKAGHYKNRLIFHVTNNSLLMGMAKTSTVAEDWVMMDDFRLYYYGTEQPSEEIVGIVEVTSCTEDGRSHELYDLSGRRVSNSAKGILILRQQQPNGTVTVRKIKQGYQ